MPGCASLGGASSDEAAFCAQATAENATATHIIAATMRRNIFFINDLPFAFFIVKGILYTPMWLFLFKI